MNKPINKLAIDLTAVSTNGGSIFHEHTALPKKKKVVKKNATTLTAQLLYVTFQLKYSTQFGQTIFVTGNHELLGNHHIEQALPLQYFNHEHWQVTIAIDKNNCADTILQYNYFLKNEDGTISFDWGNDKFFNPKQYKQHLLLIDAWNFAGFYENSFFTEPFQKVLFQKNKYQPTLKILKKPTHTFRVKAPLLQNNQTLCMIGSSEKLGKWNTQKIVLMHQQQNNLFFSVDVDFSKEQFPIAYKYGIYDVQTESFVGYEAGENRFLQDSLVTQKHTIINDAFAMLPNTTWKAAGVAIPVFSLKSNDSFGVGEFTDLKLLVNWCKLIGLKMIQILPVHDTSATFTNADSYPYAAISAFALHPMYINLSVATHKKNKHLLTELETNRKTLNEQPILNYEKVIQIKIDFLKKLYALQQAETFASKEFEQFFNNNQSWLIPYAVFCYLRDEYGSAHFEEWPHHQQYNVQEVEALLQTNYNSIAFHYFVQFHLHLQLKDAAEYAHHNGIIVKGDIPIGIYRYGTDAWQQPELYNMQLQAGAPPDDFAVKGQNWGFPTYNWHKMKEDGFAWWKQRFEQMSNYFDAFRIDHILGFFRIWSIPTHAVEGILGYFVPAIPIYINEFTQHEIDFNYNRFTKPYITENLLWQVFGYDNELVKQTFLNIQSDGTYCMKNEFETQQQVQTYFKFLEKSDHNQKLKQGLFDLISNVLLFEVEGSNKTEFHCRIGMEQTYSFKNLSDTNQKKLKELYINYFYNRQDAFWKKEALQKLPALKRVTNMLVCGEDLGMVPNCVPDVMRQLGLLSLEIQRMPKDNQQQFFHPKDAPYLSVVTPSTHDMSTIRGWWEEDNNITQQFYNNELGYFGAAPFYCEPWINKAIVVQHLASPAMWCVFQLQDLLGIDETIRRENPNDERINIPANPHHYWCYKMHLTLEDLISQTSFNNELKKLIVSNNR